MTMARDTMDQCEGGRDGSPSRPQCEGGRDGSPSCPQYEGGRDGSPSRPLGRLGEASLPKAVLPERKWLGHGVPPWVEHGIFFITINCRERGGTVLLKPESWRVISEAAHHYHGSRWWIHLWLVMPDHIHSLLSFPQIETMGKVVADWKRYVARKSGIEWQKGFFDHRLRHDESFVEKAHYIRMNPVRKGLVARPEDWPQVLAFDGRDGSPNRPPWIGTDVEGRDGSLNRPQVTDNGRLGEASLPGASLPLAENRL